MTLTTEEIQRLQEHKTTMNKRGTRHGPATQYGDADQFKARVLRALTGFDTPTKAKFIQRELEIDIAASEVGKVLAALAAEGVVEQAGHGTGAHYWRVVE